MSASPNAVESADRAPLFGCVEAGGTKFVLGLARGADAILERGRLPTTGPHETIAAAVAWLRSAAGGRPLSAIGIASFGPVVLDRNAGEWGRIAATPKPGWSGADIAGPLAAAFGCPIGFDTDVNGAALAEHRWGAAIGCDVATYVTVGTGIGGGAVIHGRPLHGGRHPEMGHIPVRRHPADDRFAGTCPFHGDCLEGLASGPAIAARWGCSLSALPADHPAQDIIAFYLAQVVVAQQALLSPQRIVMGGGVMATPGLLARTRAEAVRLAAGYFSAVDPERLIVPPGLGDDAGLHGALALALPAPATA